MLRHLHTYPKVFNTQGNLKAFPLRSPPRYNFWNAFWASVALFYLQDVYRHWTYTKYAKNDFFRKDVYIDLCRGLSSCLEKGPSIPLYSPIKCRLPLKRSVRAASFEHDSHQHYMIG